MTDGNSLSGSAQVRIDVLPVADDQAKINLAIERGLKWLYLTQNLDPAPWGGPPGGMVN